MTARAYKLLVVLSVALMLVLYARIDLNEPFDHVARQTIGAGGLSAFASIGVALIGVLISLFTPKERRQRSPWRLAGVTLMINLVFFVGFGLVFGLFSTPQPN